MSIGNATYLPALLPAIFTNQVKTLGIEKARRMFWWDEKGFFKHDSVLISAHYGQQDAETQNCREFLQIPDGAKLYGDSGGFQALTQKKVIDNEKLLDWFDRNCDFGFANDFPEKFIKMRTSDQYKNQHTPTVMNNTYKDMMVWMAESNEVLLRRKMKRCKLYNIVHGQNLKQMNEWFDTVKDDRFYGWATGIKPTDPFKVAFALAFLYHKGVKKNVHILGCSGYETIPVVIWATKWIDNITFDSSSWMAGNVYRSYCNPLDIRKKLIIGNSSTGQYTQKLPCNCPVCSSIKNTAKIYDNNATSASLVSLHNLYWMLWFTEMLKGQMQVEGDYMTTIRTVFGPEPLNAINYLNEAMVDFERANRKYADHLSTKRTLFDDQVSFEEKEFDALKVLEEPKKKGKKKKKEDIKELGEDEI